MQVCIEGHCVDPTCTTSAECGDPAAPYCVGNTCVALCDGDASCPAASAPWCAPDGACVACLDATHCGGDAPICDSATRSCRACTADNECPDGICLAYEGVCATNAEAVFVRNDGIDRGDCTAEAPCATIAFGLARLTGVRRVLRLDSIDYGSDTAIVIDRDVYLDAAGTRVTSEGSPTITFSNSATAVIENVRLNPGQVFVNNGADVIAYGLVLDDGSSVRVGVSGQPDLRATLRFIRGRAGNESRAFCEGLSRLEVQDSEFDNSKIQADFCELYVARNRFVEIADSWAVSGINFLDTLVENNFIQNAPNTQGGFVRLTTPQASPREVTVRYNTM
ncbi:MAG TPA: hypothetical protein VFD53_08495, partial [Ilumatobacter sp.]|nr:hypothetical protein [Ilumatobacter sp.]